MSFNPWTDNKDVRYILPVSYYSTIREKDLWLWDLASSREPEPKATYRIIPFIWHSGKGKTTGREKRSVVARGWGWRRSCLEKARMREFWGLIELVCIMSEVLDMWLSFVKKKKKRISITMPYWKGIYLLEESYTYTLYMYMCIHMAIMCLCVYIYTVHI